ncbi:hypothetical protein KJ966_16890 [bacterium]|nr:hypothetical protein [bacterium]
MSSLKKKTIIIGLIFVGLTIQSCVTGNKGSYESSAYYKSQQSATSKLGNKDRLNSTRTSAEQEATAFWSDSTTQGTANQKSNELFHANPSDLKRTAVVSTESSTTHGYLAEENYQYAAEDNVAGQNTASMIEGKIFKLIEAAYNRRDYNEFIELYSLYMESFPHSSQKGFLDEKRNSFFYREELHVEQLKGALLEVSYPEAKSLDELNRYFERIRDYGINSIQVDIVQFIGTPIYLFANQKKREGYYFPNSMSYVVDDLLKKITAVAHANHLKIYASFPLRHHPRLEDSATYLSDEVWNQFQNRTSPNLKLDLLNPASKVYLENLIQDLLELDIDGIVFKDDFTYELNEGFSKIAQDRFTEATGRLIAFNQIFIPTRAGDKKGFDLLTSDELEDVITWRASEIKQLIWELVDFIRQRPTETHVGIEVTPEILLDQLNPVKWYSTGLHYLKDLRVDFFVLKQSKQSDNHDSLSANYKMAVKALRESIPLKREIYLKIPLSHSTKNVIELNRHIDSHAEYQQEYPGIKIAVGPVNRLKRLDIVN